MNAVHMYIRMYECYNFGKDILFLRNVLFYLQYTYICTYTVATVRSTVFVYYCVLLHWVFTVFVPVECFGQFPWKQCSGWRECHVLHGL